LQVHYKDCRCRYSSGKEPHNYVVKIVRWNQEVRDEQHK
jgi:hypothetical protein